VIPAALFALEDCDDADDVMGAWVCTGAPPDPCDTAIVEADDCSGDGEFVARVEAR